MVIVRFTELISPLIEREVRALEKEGRSAAPEVLEEVGGIKGPGIDLFQPR